MPKTHTEDAGAPGQVITKISSTHLKSYLPSSVRNTSVNAGNNKIWPHIAKMFMFVHGSKNGQQIQMGVNRVSYVPKWFIGLGPQDKGIGRELFFSQYLIPSKRNICTWVPYLPSMCAVHDPHHCRCMDCLGSYTTKSPNGTVGMYNVHGFCKPF